MDIDIETKMFTPGQVAQHLGVNIMTIYRWIHSGALSAYRLPTGDYRIAESDLKPLLTRAKPRGPKER